MVIRAALLSVCLLVASGCGLLDGVDIADRAVATFHERYNTGSFGLIYDESADDLRENETRDEFMDIVASVRTKLGAVRGTVRTAFETRTASEGTLVALEYQTDFENGEGIEEFTWEIADGRARLLSYNVSSKALLR